jgi:hypothetical protein
VQVSSPTGLNRGLQLFWGLGVRHAVVGAGVALVAYVLYLRAHLGLFSMPIALAVMLAAAKAFAAFEAERPPGYLGHWLHRLSGMWIEGALPRKGTRYDVT